MAASLLTTSESVFRLRSLAGYRSVPEPPAIAPSMLSIPAKILKTGDFAAFKCEIRANPACCCNRTQSTRLGYQALLKLNSIGKREFLHFLRVANFVPFESYQNSHLAYLAYLAAGVLQTISSFLISIGNRNRNSFERARSFIYTIEKSHTVHRNPLL